MCVCMGEHGLSCKKLWVVEFVKALYKYIGLPLLQACVWIIHNDFYTSKDPHVRIVLFSSGRPSEVQLGIVSHFSGFPFIPAGVELSWG